MIMYMCIEVALTTTRLTPTLRIRRGLPGPQLQTAAATGERPASGHHAEPTTVAAELQLLPFLALAARGIPRPASRRRVSDRPGWAADCALASVARERVLSEVEVRGPRQPHTPH
jgi:hypothetical protein